MKKLLLILFLFIISCSSNNNKEYREVISTNLYKTNKIQIVRVNFDFNKFNLGREFIEDSIIPSLETNKNIVKIYIEGHTDSKGKDWYNYRLGLQRALTVSNIIFTNRNLQNIVLKSFGYSNSIADNSTEEGRAINRRADIFIDLVEETFELQTNLIKVDSKNKFNIDLWILLIILLLIILIVIIVIIVKFILAIRIPKGNKPKLPRSGGSWSGKQGNSIWIPNRNEVPPDRIGTNPEGRTWGEILDNGGIYGIEFKNGYPDFSKISKGEVKIDDFTDNRSSNFAQADEKLAEKLDCSPEEVEKWRKENGYTWHECEDCKTMQLVPREVHGNIPHSGGISEYKKQNS